MLNLENGKVLAQRTGEFVGSREVGTYAPEGTRFVPKTEAPILYSKTRRGWLAVLTAFLPMDFDYNAPELRLYIFNPRGTAEQVVDNYNLLSSFHIGQIFNTDSEFLVISTDCAHAYVVRTLVWLLPETGSPALLLELPAALERVQEAATGKSPGLWMDHEMYDGVHAETKGKKREFWMLDVHRRAFKLSPPP